jgi:putative hemolysin
MEDLVEELIGDIQDEYDVERPAEEQPSFGITMVDGLLNLEDFSDDTGVELPEGPYETVAGFLIARLGRVPLLGDVVVEAGHSFEVAELDGRRVSRVRVTRVAAQDEEPDAGQPGGPERASRQ